MNACRTLGRMAALAGAALSLGALDAAAQDSGAPKRYSQQAMQQALRYVDELEVQGQRIMTQAMQVALQIEPQQSMARFEESHDFFEEVLHRLQTGDPAIGLPEPEEPELIAELEALQQVWDQLDATLNRVLSSGAVTRTDVILLSQFDNILVDISRQVEEAYEHQFARTNLSSMAVTTVVQAEHQAFLIERMQTEILLMLYGHDVNAQRRELAESAAQFERTLEGLIEGNPAQRLMPPPNAETRAELRNVQRSWDEVAPMIERLVNSDTVDRTVVVPIITKMEPLYRQMERAVDHYAPQAALRPRTGEDRPPAEPEGPPNA